MVVALRNLHSQIQGNRTVVTSHGRVTDLAVTQTREQCGRQHKVVQTPADVFGSTVHHVGPEGVGIGLLRIQFPETVGETGLKKLREALTLLWGEACVLAVTLGVFKIDLLMGHIQIATQHQGLALVQAAQVGPEIHVPGLAVVQTHQTTAGIGHIRRDQEESLKLSSDNPTLFIMFLFTCFQAERDIKLTENSRFGQKFYDI